MLGVLSKQTALFAKCISQIIPVHSIHILQAQDISQTTSCNQSSLNWEDHKGGSSCHKVLWDIFFILCFFIYVLFIVSHNKYCSGFEKTIMIVFHSRIA